MPGPRPRRSQWRRGAPRGRPVLDIGGRDTEFVEALIPCVERRTIRNAQSEMIQSRTPLVEGLGSDGRGVTVDTKDRPAVRVSKDDAGECFAFVASRWL